MSTTAPSQAMNTLNIVSQQIQNLLNVHVTKYVNTGDRVVDNGVTLIIHSCIALAGAYLYTTIIKLANWVYDYYVIRRKPETDDPTDIDHVRFDYSKWSKDTIIDSKHVVEIQNIRIYTWIKHKCNNANMIKSTTYYMYPNGRIISDDENSPTYFMPLWKYKGKDGNYEYVWLIEKKLYSNNYKELCNCCSSICDLWNQVNTDTTHTLHLQEIFSNTTKLNNNKSVNPNKTIDNIYFDAKPQLINILDKFKDGRMYPNKICDNKLGILLYGPPGTGKTGTITAIANYLQRDIIMLHDTSTAAFNLLQEQLGRHADGVANYIIVFDEFDHILCDTKNENAQYLKEYKLNKLREQLRDESDDAERKKLQEQIKALKEETNAEMGLGELLRFLDGMEDQSGRLIIATTNYPDKINERLLRPGRFDLKLELGYCSMQMFCDIVRNVFPDEIDRLADLVHTQTVVAVAAAEAATSDDKPVATTAEVELTQTQTIPMEQHIAHLLEKKITPLNLINTCLKTESFAHFITELEALEPDTFTYMK